MSKPLIVYYSRKGENYWNGSIKNLEKGNTEIVADCPADTGSYGRGYKPEIKTLSVNPEDYDVIVVGTPTWWYTMAQAVLTFLAAHDWKGKTVIPFQTHGGWPGHVIRDMKAACKGAQFSHEMAIQFDSTGGAEMVTPEKDVDKWIRQIADL